MSHDSEYRYTPAEVPGPCPEHPGCYLTRCRRFLCDRPVHLALRSPGQRNRALLALTLGYLAIVLIPAGLGWDIRLSSPWGFLPYLIIRGSVLLLGGIGFALAQRPSRPDPA